MEGRGRIRVPQLPWREVGIETALLQKHTIGYFPNGDQGVNKVKDT